MELILGIILLLAFISITGNSNGGGVVVKNYSKIPKKGSPLMMRPKVHSAQQKRKKSS